MCYQGGQGKSGRQQIQEVARYPNLMVQSINQQYCGPVYPSLILPCNRIHLKLGGCNTRPGKILSILSLPDEFPLALSFAHCLAQVASNHLLSPPALAPPLSLTQQPLTLALSTCLQSLSKFLQRIDCVIPLKEVILHQVSATMWTLCSTVDLRPAEVEGELYTLPNKFLQSAQQELLKVYETETAKFSKTKSGSGKFAFPPAESIGVGGLGKFSTYFQALLEFVLAGLEYQHRFHRVAAVVPVATSSSSMTLVNNSNPPSVAGSTGGSSTTDIAPSGSGSGNGSNSGGSSVSVQSDTQSPPQAVVLTPSSVPVSTTPILALHSSRSEVSTSATPASYAAPIMATHTDPIAGKKLTKRTRSRKGLMKKDMSDTTPKKEEWLNIVQRSSAVLRAVSLHPPPPPHSAAMSCDPLPPQKSSSTVHPSSRLVVLTHLPPGLSLSAADGDIRRVCRQYGGLYKDELYLPPSGSDPSRHSGHAVLELCCSSHSSAVCSALLAAPGLQQEGGEIMQAMEVTSSLTCGGKEDRAKKILSGFLRSRLRHDGGDQTVVDILSAIFSDPSSVGPLPSSSSSLQLSQVSGSLLNFFSSFAGVCAVSATSFMAGIWEEFGDQEGLLDFAGFQKCFEQDFMLDEEHCMRGVWLGLIDSGYDFNLERWGREGGRSKSMYLHSIPSRYPLELPAQGMCSSSFSSAQDRALVGHVDSLCRHLSVTANSLQPWDIFISEAEKTSKHLSSLQGAFQHCLTYQNSLSKQI